MVIGVEMLRDRAGILRFGVFSSRNTIENVLGLHAVSTQDADQAAGIDAAGKKHSYRHIAHQLHAHGLVEHLRNLSFEFRGLFAAPALSVVAVFHQGSVRPSPSTVLVSPARLPRSENSRAEAHSHLPLMCSDRRAIQRSGSSLSLRNLSRAVPDRSPAESELRKKRGSTDLSGRNTAA